MELKNPGVYINEKNTFPNAVEVKTAIPAFIGYTEKSFYQGKSLHNQLVRVNSLTEFERFYGKAAFTKYNMEVVEEVTKLPVNYDFRVNDIAYKLQVEGNSRFNLYESIKFFYNNGGSSCFILSVGTYKYGAVYPEFTKTPFSDAIDILKNEALPTMLVIPDAVLLDADSCYKLQQEMLQHCGSQKNKVAVLDIHSGDKVLTDSAFNPVHNFRNNVSSEFLDYGAAYYPWLNTFILSTGDINYKNLTESAKLILKRICIQNINRIPQNNGLLNKLMPYLNQLSDEVGFGEEELAILVKARKALVSLKENASYEDKKKAEHRIEAAKQALAAAKKIPTEKEVISLKEAFEKETDAKKKKLIKKALDEATLKKTIVSPDVLHKVLSVNLPDYKLVMEAILKKKNVLPPSAAIAGVYTLVDSQIGVWKAPANVALNSVISPVVLINHEQQDDLNSPKVGEPICAIRQFAGMGTMVWGARTLSGTSIDFKYINVRRTIIMIEQTIKNAIGKYASMPNDSNTWVSVRAMISNFLHDLWQQGALAAATPADAYSVNVGLGTTMTENDILQGQLRIEVKVAITRPAEFIVIILQQQLQKP